MADLDKAKIVDLSHVITEGMVTYKGLPGPHICDFLSREQSAANYLGYFAGPISRDRGGLRNYNEPAKISCGQEGQHDAGGRFRAPIRPLPRE